MTTRWPWPQTLPWDNAAAFHRITLSTFRVCLTLAVERATGLIPLLSTFLRQGRTRGGYLPKDTQPVRDRVERGSLLLMAERGSARSVRALSVRGRGGSGFRWTQPIQDHVKPMCLIETLSFFKKIIIQGNMYLYCKSNNF